MGIKGLTKFMNDRSNLYFENYELHDCSLIIDGHSLSCQLYNWKHWPFEARSTNCYGGDYDKYAFIVESFFIMLDEANITPYVIFDGGFEERKLPTILTRMQDKICIADQLTPEFESKQPNKVVFPLFLREVFKDVIRNRDIKLAMCKYEGDAEIASIAKLLNCPVLTFDSDYFLFGCQYIPFTTFDSKVKTIDNWRTGRYKCIQCKLYKIDKFLEDYKGLQEETVHLLPVLLGNDYIDEKVFIPFLQSINIRLEMPWQEKIQALLSWLKNESLETAIKKILCSFKTKEDCCSILGNIEKIVSGYYYVESGLLSYLNINQKANIKERRSNFKILKKRILEHIESNVENNHDEAGVKIESGDIIKESNLLNLHLNRETSSQNPVSNIFMKNYQKCVYPSSFMDILTQNKYYCIPQVEDHTKKHSNIHSTDLLCVIHKIISNSADSEFIVIARDEGTTVKWFPQEKCTLEIPQLEEFEQLALKDRREVLFKILKMEDNFTSFLEHLPTEWHIFLIGLKYSLSKTSLITPFIYSLVLCFIILNYIDQKIGFFRSSKKLKRRYPSQSSPPLSEHFRADKNCFYYFPDIECIVFMKKIIHFFEVDPKETDENFDRDLIHSMAEIQSIFLHLKYLNSLLNFPYSNLLIHRIFDGTFLYNATKNFKEISSDLENNNLNVFLQECPSILAGLKYVLSIINKEFSL